jgi:hypothetical protein
LQHLIPGLCALLDRRTSPELLPSVQVKFSGGLDEARSANKEIQY